MTTSPVDSAVTCLACWADCLVSTGMLACAANPCTQAHTLNWSRAEPCSREMIETLLSLSEATAALRGKPTVCPTPPPWILVFMAWMTESFPLAEAVAYSAARIRAAGPDMTSLSLSAFFSLSAAARPVWTRWRISSSCLSLRTGSAIGVPEATVSAVLG